MVLQSLSPLVSSAIQLAQRSGGGAGLVPIVVIVVLVYVYFALSLSTIARKTGTPDEWMAWVPILNVYLMIKCAGRPGWWLILMFVPLVNFICSLLIWIEIAERRKKSVVLGVLTCLFPILVGLLAAGD